MSHSKDKQCLFAVVLKNKGANCLASKQTRHILELLAILTPADLLLAIEAFWFGRFLADRQQSGGNKGKKNTLEKSSLVAFTHYSKNNYTPFRDF